MANRSKTMRNGMIAAGIGLLGWAATRKRGKVQQGLAAVVRRVEALAPTVRDRLESVLPALRDGLGTLLPPPLRTRLGMTTDEQPSVVDPLGVRRALRALPSPVVHDAVVTRFSSLERPQWDDFGVALVQALQAAGVQTSRLTHELGLSTNDVYQMRADDLGRLIAFTQNNHPDVLASVVAEHGWIMDVLGSRRLE